MEKAEGRIKRGKGVNGRNLCKFCAKEVPPRRRTYCSPECIREWELRNNPKFLENELFKLQKGICQDCGIDCEKLRWELLSLPAEERLLKMKEYGISEHRMYTRLWDIDHVVPVVFGGGIEVDGIPMDIEKFVQTLCVICHQAKTYELTRSKELKEHRRKKKIEKRKSERRIRLLRIEPR